MLLSWKRIITSHLANEDFKVLGFTLRFELSCLAVSCILLTGAELLENEMLVGYIQLFILHGISTTLLISRLLSFYQARNFLARLGGCGSFDDRVREVVLEGSYAILGFGIYLLTNSMNRILGTKNPLSYVILTTVDPAVLSVSAIIMFHLLYKENMLSTHKDALANPVPMQAKAIEGLSQENYSKLDEEI
ncbi:hypothetical protein K493DRAFT_313356 [Basidiobolus meristosporus CBS 931.73]|uniref:Uncharacterized protein n=1 Tax=Basidiobolus meristosporus CBS 931.73 TaxID=1314790 RepID=A0A1Y1YMA0_9FUNG|nr:hypothetical protein K493DRAFT_313356 [Basidiobolus meristosporus CBS 931.73]|eukprot:ORX99121.1 hypothetical protein K493DRAFT_313356 [Basidiobolus meristosporus CBS 931.73]